MAVSHTSHLFGLFIRPSSENPLDGCFWSVVPLSCKTHHKKWRVLIPLSASLCSQRLLKSITPEPSTDSNRDFIVTNAIWRRAWRKSLTKKKAPLKVSEAPSPGHSAKPQDKGATFHRHCLSSYFTSSSLTRQDVEIWDEVRLSQAVAKFV